MHKCTQWSGPENCRKANWSAHDYGGNDRAFWSLDNPAVSEM